MREFIASVFVVLLLVLFAAGVAMALGFKIPIVDTIRGKIGF